MGENENTSTTIPVMPPGMIDRVEARRMFGVSMKTWKRWVYAGRVPGGEWVRVPGARGRRKVLPREEIERLLAAFRALGQPYPDPQRPDCWRVPVMSFETTRCEAIVDAASVPLVAGRRWNWEPPANGSVNAAAVIQLHPEGKSGPRRVTMPRVILGLRGRQWKVTHANGDPLDCRRANLVVRDGSEHAASARKQALYGGRPCTSRFKGVQWEKARGKWRVMIKRGQDCRCLGRFDDEIEAAQAYDAAARELYGEHARLNFPDGVDTAAPTRAAA
jgi:hypothetical protein